MTKHEKALEQIWIIRAKEGELDAFDYLVGKYHNRLHYYIRRMINDDELAKDIIQTVWLQAFRKISTLRHPEAFSVWLYRIARNFTIQQIRKDQQEVQVFGEYEMMLQDETVEVEFSQFDGRELHKALTQLRPIHKETLLLRVLEEMSYEQIAELTGCTLGTVRSRLFYAKQKLQSILEKMEHE